MSQEQVIEVLKNNKRKWLTTKDISRIADISEGSVNNSCKKLRNYNEVLYKKLKKGSTLYYKYKLLED